MTGLPWWLLSIIGLAVATGVGLAAWGVLFWLLGRAVGLRWARPVERSLVNRSRVPARALLPLLAWMVALAAAPLPPDLAATVGHLLRLALIAGLAWLAVGLSRVPEDVLLSGDRVRSKDNLAARSIETRMTLIRNIVDVAIGLVAAAIALLTFPGAQQIGASLLASAGLIGLVGGIAATPVLSNLIAGMQLAFTQPIRLDDVLVVQGDWGRVEEITTTYVVVRIWDQRRLVVPLSYFITNPVENWTRRTADLLGTVFLYVDYTVPVDVVREELKRLLAATPLWNGQVCVVQVTDATERSVQLRALVSAADSSALWDLRCYVREGLVAFLRERYPGCLPRSRLEWGLDGATGGGPPRAATP